MLPGQNEAHKANVNNVTFANSSHYDRNVVEFVDE